MPSDAYIHHFLARWEAPGRHTRISPERCTPNGSWVPFNGSIPYKYTEVGNHEIYKRPECNSSENWKYTWQSSRHGVVSYLSSDKLCNLVPQGETVLFVGDSLTGQLVESWTTRIRKARGVHDPCFSRVKWSKNLGSLHLWGFNSSSGVLDFNKTIKCSESNHPFCNCTGLIQSPTPLYKSKPLLDVVDNDLNILGKFEPTVVIVNQFAHLGYLFRDLGSCYQKMGLLGPNDPYDTVFRDVFTFWHQQVELQARAMSTYSKRTGARIFYRTSAVPSTLNLTIPSSHAGLYLHPKVPSFSSNLGHPYYGHEFYWLVNDMSAAAYTGQGLSVLDVELMLGSRPDASPSPRTNIHMCLPGAIDLALDQILLSVYRGRDCVSEPKPTSNV